MAKSHEPCSDCGHERINDVNRLCPFFSISNASLPVFAGKFSVSMSLLHLIVPPLRLLGLVIVTVALMKEPLLKVTCATSEESSIRFNLTVSLFKKKFISNSPVLITQLRNPTSLVHQNITISLDHVSSLPLT